jgi:hypothetical protein
MMTQFADLGDLWLRFTINVVAMAILLFGLYYHRHGDRTLVTTAAMFNIFAFAVLGKISSVEFGLAAGFGLFAILALFNLRSVQIGRVEIAYFFGAVALAVICSIEGSPTASTVAISGLVLLSVYVIDHPALMRGTNAVTLTLDEIKPKCLTSPEMMRDHIGQRLGIKVISFEIVSLNLVKGLAVLDLKYKDTPGAKSSWLNEEPREARSQV